MATTTTTKAIARRSPVSWARLWLAVLLAGAVAVRRVHGDYFPECDNVADDTFVATREGCQKYIMCQGMNSYMDECDDGEYFDAEAEVCDARENVYCPLDEPLDTDDGEEGETEEEEDGEGEEEGDDGDGDEPPSVEEPVAPPPQPTPVNPAQPTPAAPSQPTETRPPSPYDSNVAPIVRDTCPLTDNPNEIVLMANKQSCSDYYLCYHGNAIEMHCTNHLHFNVYTGKCDFPEKVQCVIERPSAATCLPHVTDFFPHPDKCNYFYYCIRGYLTVQQCPFYYGWDVEKRSCVHISKAVCHKNAKKP